MSANNVIWVLYFKGYYHVWYSGCYDNVPRSPDQNGTFWKYFKTREEALVYGHDLVKRIEGAGSYKKSAKWISI